MATLVTLDNKLKELKTRLQASEEEKWAQEFVGAHVFLEILCTNVRYRPFNDGGGICSPGRWPPEQRGVSKLPVYREALREVVQRCKLDNALRAR